MNLKHVSFTRMEDGTKEDYEFLEELESDAAKGLADRILKELQRHQRHFGRIYDRPL